MNAQFLFDVVDTPRQPAPTASDVFDECILETNVLLGLLLVYYKSTYRGGLPKFLHDQSPSRLLPVVAPLLLIVFVMSRLVFPWQRRRPMWGCLARIVRARSDASTRSRSRRRCASATCETSPASRPRKRSKSSKR